MNTNGLEIRLAPTLLCAALFCLILGGNASGEDSCITCHTDGDLLEENLADTQNKTSTLQAGSG